MRRRSPSNRAIVCVLAAVGVAALSPTVRVPFPEAFLSFAIFVALGGLLEIPVARGAVFSLSLAPALGFALLRQCAEPLSEGPCAAGWVSHGPGEVAIVFLLGTLAAAGVRIVRKEQLQIPTTAARALVVVAAAAVYQAVVAIAPDLLFFGHDRMRMSAPGLGALLVVVLGLEVPSQAILASPAARIPFVPILRGLAKATGPLLLSSVSIAALLALAYPPLGWWALPLFLAPLAATHFSFRQFASIRRTYLQTVRALSKVPEMAGYTEPGHSTRVAELAVAIAQELAIGDPDLGEIEYAALLHDIGRVSLPDPADASESTSRLELALVGAQIVEQTGYFPRVARMVREQHEQYRRRGEDTNRELTIGAKIIKVASAYDDLTRPPGPGHTPWDALERLHLGMAYEYDPNVIQGLTRVLEKNGLI